MQGGGDTRDLRRDRSQSDSCMQDALENQQKRVSVDGPRLPAQRGRFMQVGKPRLPRSAYLRRERGAVNGQYQGG